MPAEPYYRRPRVHCPECEWPVCACGPAPADGLACSCPELDCGCAWREGVAWTCAWAALAGLLAIAAWGRWL